MQKTTRTVNSSATRLSSSSDPVASLALHWLHRTKQSKSGLLYRNEENANETDARLTELSSPARTITGKGMLLSLACCAFFSLQSLCVRLGQVDTVTSLVVRSIIQLSLCIPSTILNSRITKIQLPWKRPSLLLIGIFSSLTVAAEYFSFRNLPLGDATVLLLGTAPVFTGLLARVLIKEKWPLADIAAAVLSIGGVMCVARPTFVFGSLKTVGHGANNTSEQWQVDNTDDSTTLGAFAVFTALGGALTTAFGFLAVRKAGRSVNYIAVSIYSSIIAGLGSAVYLCAKKQNLDIPCSKTWTRYFLVAIGVTGFLGQITGTKAIQLQSASTVALVRYLDVPVSFTFELLFFRRELNVFSLMGATVIVIAATAAGLIKLRQERRQRRHEISKEQKRRFV